MRATRRRDFLKLGLLGIPGAMVHAHGAAATKPPRSINLSSRRPAAQDSTGADVRNLKLRFSGQNYIEVPNSPELSVPSTGQLSVSAVIELATLNFSHSEAEGYVHWLGKGETGNYEWGFRIYSQNTIRPNRISFYVWNLGGAEGVGSYFQDQLQVGQPIHVTAVVDGTSTHIFKNGALRDSDSYVGAVSPQHGRAPLRIGTRDMASFFEGCIYDVRVWNRALSGPEVQTLYSGALPQRGLVAEYSLDQTIVWDGKGVHHGRLNRGSWTLLTR